MQPENRARLELVAAAALFSTGGAVIKSIQLGSYSVAGLRSLIAALAVLVFIPASRRLLRRDPWLVGIAFACTLILFVKSNKLTTSLNAIGLQSTAPLYLVLLAPLLLKERVRALDLALLGAVGLGMALFFLGRERVVASAPDPVTGNLIAAASGLSWAFTVLGLRALGRKGGPEGASLSSAAVAAGNLIAAAVALPLAAPEFAEQTIRAVDVGYLVFLGVVQIGMAYVLVTRGVRRVGAVEASLLLLVEPVLNPVWSFLVHGERPSAPAIAGAVLIFAATAAKARLEARAPRPLPGSSTP